MEIQILKQEYKNIVRSNPRLKAEIAAANDCSNWTVDRWRIDNSPMLTTATNLAIIKNFLKLNDDVILTDVVEAESHGAVSVGK
jgi:hypothetical protein